MIVSSETIANTVWNSFPNNHSFPEESPQIAHYTSIETLDQILKNNEVWLSHPLQMNDIQELQHGINLGRSYLFNSTALKESFSSDEKYLYFINQFEDEYKKYVTTHAFETYIMCFSEIDRTDEDGRLSMWRGYGDLGKGAALVFDLNKLDNLAGSPLTIAKVEYLSKEDRENQMITSIETLCAILNKIDQSDENLSIISKTWIDRLKIFALYTKHIGFIEEQEWRMVYMPEKDIDDKLSGQISYHINSGNIEPKLKLNVTTIKDVIGESALLSNFLERIILGPSPKNTHLLTSVAIEKMLISNGYEKLTNKLSISSIPFR